MALSICLFACLLVNSLAPGKFEGISYEIALTWMPLDLTDKSTLVQVMAWCHQATSHYLSQCWPRSISPNGVSRPQWVNLTWCTFGVRVFPHKLFSGLTSHLVDAFIMGHSDIIHCWSYFSEYFQFHSLWSAHQYLVASENLFSLYLNYRALLATLPLVRQYLFITIVKRLFSVLFFSVF